MERVGRRHRRVSCTQSNTTGRNKLPSGKRGDTYCQDAKPRYVRWGALLAARRGLPLPSAGTAEPVAAPCPGAGSRQLRGGAAEKGCRAQASYRFLCQLGCTARRSNDTTIGIPSGLGPLTLAAPLKPSGRIGQIFNEPLRVRGSFFGTPVPVRQQLKLRPQRQEQSLCGPAAPPSSSPMDVLCFGSTSTTPKYNYIKYQMWPGLLI